MLDTELDFFRRQSVPLSYKSNIAYTTISVRGRHTTDYTSNGRVSAGLLQPVIHQPSAKGQ